METYKLDGIYKLNGTVQVEKIPNVDFSPTPISTPKYKFDINIWLTGCGWWQFIPPSEQQVPPQFWDLILNDKETLEINLNVGYPAEGKCGYGATYLRFHNATFKNIPVGSQDIGCFWIYMDGKPILNNPLIPQYFAAPSFNPYNPDASWGSGVNILFDGDNIKTGLTKYDLVYRGRNPFSPKSFEINTLSVAWDIC